MEIDPDIDFDAIYQGAYPFIPWDIAEAQPAVIEWDEAGGFSGDVLDIGCGTGDNAVYLASRGHSVTAIDGAPGAIETARERAAARGVPVTFAVADAFALPEAERYDTILDSALYHCLPSERRATYVAELYRVARPGARLNLLGVSERAPEGTPPSRVTERELRDDLTAAGWRITALRPATITSVIPTEFGLDLPTDADGRMRIPAWAVEAVR